MLTSREAASLILIGAVALVFTIFPGLKRTVAPPFKNLLKAACAPRLLVVYLVVLAMSAASTALAWRIGIWDQGLLKDAIILTLTVVLPMTFRSLSFRSGGELAQKLIRETLGLTALLTFYLDATPLPLVGELVFQTVAVFLILFQGVARTNTEWHPVKRICEWILGLMGLALLAWSTFIVVSSPPDWPSFLGSLTFSFWLPLSLLPFFYVFGFYGVTETVRARFRALRHSFTLRLMIAFMIGTRLRLSLLTRFSGRYNNVAESDGLRDGLRRMREFREDLKRRDQEETERLNSLKKNAGKPGTDDEGLHLDRRDFEVTKSRLNWIWTCQNGQYEQQGRRYWDHLTDLVVDAERHELPSDHGFVVEIAEGGQIWRAWRRTPGGAVLGLGGAARQSKYYFQGEDLPKGWPGASPEWMDAARDTSPPDWNRNDSSRL